MSRVAIIHNESGDLREYSSYDTVSIVSTVGLDMPGNYCLRTGIATNTYASKYISPRSELYVNMYLRVTGAQSIILLCFCNNTFLNKKAWLTRTEGGTLEFRIGNGWGTIVTTGVGPILPAITYRLEIHYIPHASSGVFQVWINGILSIDYTGNTTPDDLSINFLRFGGDGYFYGWGIYYDNIIIDDENYIGNSQIEVKVPKADSLINKDWIASNDSTSDLYTLIDEVPPSATDYLKTNDIDQTSTFTTDILSGEIGEIKSVMVQTYAVQRGEPLPTNIQNVLRIDGVDYPDGSNKPVPYLTAQPLSTIWETNPATLGSWDESAVNNLEFGFISKI